jgi:flagellar biosynthesis protein FlhB
MSEAGEKKFELSDKRREKLRQEGSIPKSHDVTTTTTLGVGLAMMVWGGGMVVGYLREVMRNAFVEVGQAGHGVTPQTVGGLFSSSLWMWIGLFLIVMAAAVFISQVAQVGLNIGDEVLTVKLEKLNPLAGLKQIFSVNRLTQTGQNLIKLGVISAFAYLALQEFRDSPVFARPVSLAEMGKVYTDVAWTLGWRIVMVLGAMAAGDFLWQRWKFNYDHRMTFEEVKEERRSNEASPEVIKKRRMMARKVSMRRMLENMKDATIVVTNPTHYAVALKYKRGVTDAPIIVAKGIRGNALRIKALAYDLRIAVREDRPLARGLYKYGKIDQPIPAIFYQGVATILAALYKQGFQASENYARPAVAAAGADTDEIWNTEND